MKLENSFEVPADPAAAWSLLLDMPRVIPCMPGAELTEVVDDSNWKGKMSVKLGPISLSFATDVALVEADEAARRVRLSAKARETRGRGSGQATIESTLSPLEQGTRIDIATDLTLAGALAQYGRGLVEDVSKELVGRFADCLSSQLTATPEQAEAAAAAPVKPVGGLGLGLRAVGRSIGRFFRRLFGRS